MRLTLSRPDYLYDNDLLNQCLCDIFICVRDYCFNSGSGLDETCKFWLILALRLCVCVTVKLHQWADSEAFVWIQAGNGSLRKRNENSLKSCVFPEFLIMRWFSCWIKSGQRIKQISMLLQELSEVITVEYLNVNRAYMQVLFTYGL